MPTTPQSAHDQFEPLLHVEQAAALLGGMHVKTLQRLARSKAVPAYRIGRFWYFRASELDAWLGTIRDANPPRGARKEK